MKIEIISIYEYSIKRGGLPYVIPSLYSISYGLNMEGGMKYNEYKRENLLGDELNRQIPRYDPLHIFQDPYLFNLIESPREIPDF